MISDDRASSHKRDLRWLVDAQRRIAELETERDAERARSERLELQIGALLEQVTALTRRVAS